MGGVGLFRTSKRIPHFNLPMAERGDRQWADQRLVVDDAFLPRGNGVGLVESLDVVPVGGREVAEPLPDICERKSIAVTVGEDGRYPLIVFEYRDALRRREWVWRNRQRSAESQRPTPKEAAKASVMKRGRKTMVAGGTK